MRAVDANILVRPLVRDNAEQTAIATEILAERVFVPRTVLLETTWLLSKTYRQPRSVVADTLDDILDAHVVADTQSVRWAVERYRAGADFADMLHLIDAKDADAFVTFDRQLAREAGNAAPVAVQVVV